MLRIQYAARVCYNRAETVGLFVWLCALAAELCVFLPNRIPEVVQWVVPTCFCVLGLVLASWYVKLINNGASLRNFFDAYVLGLGFENYKAEDRRSIKELSLHIDEKKPGEANVQMSNTGRDKPAGVKDWYEFDTDVPLTDMDAVFECQKQNRWWNNELSKKRIFASACIVSFIVAAFAISLFIFPDYAWKIIICSTGLALRGTERLIEHIKYYNVSRKIDWAVETMDCGFLKTNLLSLQESIAERRKIHVLESSKLHQKYAALLAEKYSKVKSNM